MLDVSGFEVVDLGVDVPTAEFVGKIRGSARRSSR